MSGQRISYIHVSRFDQNPERQLEQVPVDRVFTDKASGKDIKRPALDRLLTFVRKGIRWWCIAWIAITSAPCRAF